MRASSTPSARVIRRVRVPWSSASFLVYLGGLTILSSTLALISIQSNEHGAGGLVLWTA